MLTRITFVAFASLLMATTATAQQADPAPLAPSDAQLCAKSFKARLADAKRAIAAHTAYERNRVRVMGWCKEHCRNRSEVEAALAGEGADQFVCSGSGRPRELSQTWLKENDHPKALADFEKLLTEDRACAAVDPLSLDLSLPTKPQPQRRYPQLFCSPPMVPKAQAVIDQLWEAREQQLAAEVECYGQKNAQCTQRLSKAAEVIAALRNQLAVELPRSLTTQPM